MCTCSGYHALKSKVRESQFTDSGSNIDFGSGATLCNNWTLYAQKFGAEAGELALATRCFSVPKFISFLMNGGVHVPDLAITDPVQLIAHHDDLLAMPVVQAPHST